MKTKCAVYDCYKKSEPIGYCVIDLGNPVISYSTYRRLMRLCIPGSYFFISAPVNNETYCNVSGFDNGSVSNILIKPLV